MNMDAAIIPLQEMNITQCGKGSRGRAQGKPGGCQEGALSYPAPLIQPFAWGTWCSRIPPCGQEQDD